MQSNLRTSNTPNRTKVFHHKGVILPYEDIESVTLKEGGRFYTTPEGMKYPSITTVLAAQSKELLDEWKSRVGGIEAKRVSRHASTRGTSVHDAMELYLKNQENIFGGFTTPVVRKNVKDLIPIVDRHLDNIHIQEKPLYSRHLGVAGRVDCIGEWDGRVSSIDFKTSSKPKKEEWIHAYFMQEAFYAIAYEEITGIPVPRLVTIIAVDYSEPQVFVQRRDDWAEKLIDAIKTFNDKSLDNGFSLRENGI